MKKPSFNDPDLRTPAHDAIMLWLDEHAASVISAAYQRTYAGCSTRWEVDHQHMTRSFHSSGHHTDRVDRTYHIDMVITAWISGEHQDKPYAHDVLACEVKPAIRSIGELIRQLRQYESKKWRVAVVSPDDRFREIIERQGFIFIKAPQPDYGPQGGLF